jgi:hypothetical protein
MKRGMRLNNSQQLILLDEPFLSFGYEQAMFDPRDGLFLFGPLMDKRNPQYIRTGLIGTHSGISRYKRWAQRVKGYIPPDDPNSPHHKAFPGFESIFGVKWPEQQVTEIEIPDKSLFDSLRIKDRHQAIYTTVGLFEEAIRTHFR